ncbi:MAG: flavodoxin, partial [Acidimicrobiia bacterium]
MKALVVYESMFGNTKLIAEAVAGGLTRHLDVETVEVGQKPVFGPGVDLVVVGGPTHAFGMTRASTRKSAAEQ